MSDQFRSETQAESPKLINSNKEANQWAMFVHLSLFAGYLIPFGGLILPIVLWQIKKDEFPIVDTHGKNVANWAISLVIYFAAACILLLLLIGFLILPILGIISIVFPIIGAIKANNGEVWEYPLAIKFFR